MRKILRRILRKVLKILTKATLQKHDPRIIALIGESKTAPLRESLYAVLHKYMPTRRNIESPEAEFVVPLTIIGTNHYPQTSKEWLFLVGKTILQLIFLPIHQNVLILEFNTKLSEILNYWLEITQPEFTITCGSHPPAKHLETRKTYNLTEEDSTNLEKITKIVQKIGENLGLPSEKIQQELKKTHLPQPRIKILPGKNGYMVIDATYIYFPPLKESIEETLSSLTGRKVWIRNEEDWEKAQPNPHDVVVVIGRRNALLNVLEEAVLNPLET